MLAILIGATLVAVPAIDARFQQPWALSVRYHAPQIAAPLALGLWAATLWHATVVPGRRLLHRGLVLAVLVIGNIIAAFLYYFLYLHWVRGARRREGQVPAAAV